MKIPQVLSAEWVHESCVFVEIEHGMYTLARPLPYYSIFARWKCAWLVLTGKADALIWRDQ